jgi:DDE superfamily endonuclease
MDAAPAYGWEDEFERWLEPFLKQLRRKAQQHWAPVYLKGLILPGERKSIEPMATRVAPGDTQQLHHFVSTSPWLTAPLEDELVQAADRLVGGPDAVLVIDDTALVSRGGTRSGSSASIAVSSASERIVSPWSPLPWLVPRCRSVSAYGCSCPRTGARIWSGGQRPACPRRSTTGRNGGSPSMRPTGSSPQVPGLDAFWLMPSTARRPSSAAAWASGTSPRRSASCRRRRSTRPR